MAFVVGDSYEYMQAVCVSRTTTTTSLSSTITAPWQALKIKVHKNASPDSLVVKAYHTLDCVCGLLNASPRLSPSVWHHRIIDTQSGASSTDSHAFRPSTDRRARIAWVTATRKSFYSKHKFMQLLSLFRHFAPLACITLHFYYFTVHCLRMRLSSRQHSSWRQLKE